MRRWSRPSIFALIFKLHSFRSENSSGSSAISAKRKVARRAAQHQQARAHLTAAITMYHEMGMQRWLEPAQAELGALA